METNNNIKIASLEEQIKTLEEQLQKSEKLASLGTLSAGIAHEIQNPLNFVINFSQMANDMVDDLTDIFDEKDIDVVTALSGSGPAYYYYIIDLMAKAAHKLGLDYKTCLALSAQTALGSAKMILEDNKTPDELIVAVTTPGGCTAVGNEVLAKSDIADVIDKTIKDTMEKAKALG